MEFFTHPEKPENAPLQASLGEREQALEQSRRELEARVGERTIELQQTNERLRAEISRRQEAEERRARLAAIVESAGDAIVSKDLRGIVTSWNAAAEQLFGYRSQEMIGQSITKIIPPELQDQERVILESIARGKRYEHSETVRLTRDGRRVEVSLCISPIRDQAGRVIGAAKIARDITGRKRAEERLVTVQQELQGQKHDLEKLVAERTAHLEATNKSLETLCYNLAHDLRAPNRSMQGFAELLLGDYAQALDATGQDYLRRIAAAAARNDLLILDMLTYGRLGHAPLPCSPQDLKAALEAVLQSLAGEIKGKGARVQIKPPLPSVQANPVALEQALTNLLTNALKFVAPGVTPLVTVWSEDCASGVRLHIQDNGIGIASQHYSLLFRVFERLPAAKAYPGTGIGLAIVQKAAERMGGQVGLESEPGKGSCFWIELPRAAT